MIKHIESSLNAYHALQEALNDHNTPQEVCDDFRPAAYLAYSKLSSMFAHHSKFSEAWLSDTSEGSNERIRSQLLEWLQDIAWYKGKDRKRALRSVKVPNSKKCRAAVKQLLKDGSWIFVKMIR
jgi:hypothetical protein